MLSVIVPLYNAAAFLPEALDSVLCQPETAEVVVVDDGSVDDCANALRPSPRVRLIQQSHLGPAATRNTGVRAARGTHLAFLDADDLWLEGKLASQLRVLRRSPHAVCVCDFTTFLNPGDPLPKGARKQKLGVRLSAPLLSTTVLPRAVFDAIGPFDESLHTAEDIEWFCRAATLGVERIRVPQVMVRKRLHRTNTSLVTPGNTERLVRVLRQRVAAGAHRLGVDP